MPNFKLVDEFAKWEGTLVSEFNSMESFIKIADYANHGFGYLNTEFIGEIGKEFPKKNGVYSGSRFCHGCSSKKEGNKKDTVFFVEDNKVFEILYIGSTMYANGEYGY